MIDNMNMIPIRINLLVLTIIAVMFIGSPCIGADKADPADPVSRIMVIYLSDNRGKLKAVFDNVHDLVEVTLPNGRQINLPRGISASGARFTDGKETFWEHHGEGSYWVDEELIFRGNAE